MTPQANDILQEARKLPPMERAELVERILETFPFPERQAVDALWAAEAEARIDAYERGEIAASSAGEVFSRIQKVGG